MKKDQLKNLVGHHMRIRPITKRPSRDKQLPQIDDDWIVQTIHTDKIELLNIRTHHAAILGLDQIHSYMSDPARDRSGIKHGFFQLRIQLSILPNDLQIEPLPPGEWGTFILRIVNPSTHQGNRQ